MSIQRDSIPFGPAKIVQGATTFYSAGDIDVTVITEFADVNPDQHGQGVKTVLDQTIEVSFKPQSVWANLAKVYPASHIAPTIGARLIGANPVPVVIHGESGALLTIPCPAHTGLASTMLGVDKGEHGDMKFTGVCTNGKSPGENGALYTYAAAGGNYGNPVQPDYLAAAQWDMAWGDNVLAGTLLEAVTLNPDFKIEPVKFGPRTVDFRFKGTQFAAGVVAAHDLPDLSDLNNDGATVVFGGRNTAQGKDLVLTSALGHTLTLVAAAIEKSGLKFGMKEAAPRAIDFRTSALAGARISWTTPE